MIVITGAAGFIGSVVAGSLNQIGREDLVLVDDFSKKIKERNFRNKKCQLFLERERLHEWLKDNHSKVDFIVHLGARTDTTEFDWNVFAELNVNYTERLWTLCAEYSIPLIYASSAATYGGGEFGYDDSHQVVDKLVPLNPYGRSKNEIDKWILSQEKCPPFWAGLKFFNVYGPNEYHKGRMASVILHSFHQILDNGEVRLFRSHRPDFEDGKQLRDFVYVKDIASVILLLIERRPESGFYNLGTGNARSFLDLATNTFYALNKEPNIKFIDTPLDIRDKYQYFTEAKMDKLRNAGYDKPFTSLEDGIADYVKNYLVQDKTF